MAISYAVTSFVSSANATTTTGNLSHTVGGNVSLLVVQIALRRSATANTSIVSVVWDGNALTNVTGTTQDNPDNRVTTAIYYLDAPAVATGNLVVTWTTGHLCSYGVVALNVTGSTGIPTNGDGVWNTLSSPNLGVSSTAGYDVIDVIATKSGETLTVGADQTILYSTISPVGSSSMVVCGSIEVAVDTQTQMEWTISSSTSYAQSACNIQPVANTDNFFLMF